MRGGPTFCMDNRHLKRRTKLFFTNMKNLYSWSTSQYLPTGNFHEIEFAKKNEKNFSKPTLRARDNSLCGYLKECEFEYPSNKHEKIKKSFPLLAVNKQLY